MGTTIAIVLAVTFAVTGLVMASGRPSSVEQGRHLGFAPRTYRMLGLLQLAGAAALVIGIFWTPMAVAAAVGFSLMMVGAVVVHLRAGDPAGRVVPAVVFGLASITTAALHLA